MMKVNMFSIYTNVTSPHVHPLITVQNEINTPFNHLKILILYFHNYLNKNCFKSA